MSGVRVVWAPHPGGQLAFLACPHFECLFEGARGPGKTDALLMDFAQHVGRSHGQGWRGVLFRRQYKQLDDVVAKTRKWFPRIFPKARFLSSKGEYRWVFPEGEELLLRQLNGPADYWDYHGHEYPWIGFEELTNWPTDECYQAMKSCCRSSRPGMPRKIRATCNPFGPGHNWVKAYFVDPAPAGTPVTNEAGLTRVRLTGRMRENQALMEADPGYARTLASLADPHRRKAWLEGSWDVTAGGALDDLWDRNVHMVPPFPIPPGWRVDRSFDWGSSRPFSVGWWAEADGCDARLTSGEIRSFPKGTLFRVAELYGWTGRPNEGQRLPPAAVARKILEMEHHFQFPVRPGPADPAIFAAPSGTSVAEEMAAAGVRWEKARTGPGSRRAGLELVRKRLAASAKNPMEEPGLFVFDTCAQFVRTVPCLPRDERDPDDADTTAEDHAYDETRYRLLSAAGGGGAGRMRIFG